MSGFFFFWLVKFHEMVLISNFFNSLIFNKHACGGCFVERLWKMGEDLRISQWFCMGPVMSHLALGIKWGRTATDDPLTFFIHDTPWEEDGCVSKRSAPCCPVPHSQHSLVQSKPKYFSHAVLSNGVRCHDIPDLAPWTIYVTQADCSTPPDAHNKRRTSSILNIWKSDIKSLL